MDKNIIKLKDKQHNRIKDICIVYIKMASSLKIH